jgi:hypothetical protein
MEQNEVKPEPMMSASIAELAKALCEVQKTELFALTTSNNPFFKSKYADLSSVWDAIRKPLTDNGLSVVQTTEPIEDAVIIITTLLHSSGEWIRGRLMMKPDKMTPQGFGSAITYGRRYALAAIVGISPEDDDGEKAMGREKRRQSVQKPPPKEGDPEIKPVDDVCDKISRMKVLATLQNKQRAWFDSDKSDYTDEEVKRINKAFEIRIAILSAGNSSDKKITSAQAQRLYAIGAKAKPTPWTHDMIISHIKEKYGWDTSKDLTVAQYNEVEAFIAANEAVNPVADDLEDALNVPLIFPEQVQNIYDAARQQDLNMVKTDAELEKHFNVASAKYLRADQYDAAINLFE